MSNETGRAKHLSEFPKSNRPTQENGLISHESYEIFPTHVIPLKNPNVLYIEIEGGMISGELGMDENGIPMATIDLVAVNSGRNQGKGTYLTTTFAQEAALRGARLLASTLSNPAGMRNHIRVFGADKLEAIGDHAVLNEGNPEEYARQLIEKAGEGIDVRVRLDDGEVLRRLFHESESHLRAD